MKQQLRYNDKIRAREVRLIDAKGKQLGLVPIDDALARAKQDELDLVEVAPDAEPPVCKIMDYARYHFEQKRKLKESRKKAKTMEMKEIKLKPRIDPHDYGIKIMHLKEFVEKGHKVKVSLRFRMNELRHADLGRKLLARLVQETAEVAELEQNTGREDSNRVLTLVLAPKKKH